MKRIPWDVCISPASNGVMVKVGCVNLLYTVDAYELLANDLSLYLKDHDAAIKAINERWGLKVMEGPSGQPCEVGEERPTVERVGRGEDTAVKEGPTETPHGRELTEDQEDSLVETAKEEKRARETS